MKLYATVETIRELAKIYDQKACETRNLPDLTGAKRPSEIAQAFHTAAEQAVSQC